MRLLKRGSCLGVLIGWICAATVAADERVDDILDAWRLRQQNSRAVKYVYTGKCTVPRGTHTGNPMLGPDVKGDVPPRDHQFDQNITLLLDFERNWVRKEIEEERLWLEDGKFYPVCEVRMYDGEQFQEYKPKARNRIGGRSPQLYQVELDVQTDGYARFVFENSEYPLFFSHGVFPNGEYTISPVRLRVPLDSNWFHYHGEAPVDGVSCQILRTKAHSNGAYSDYWVDPKRDGAVLRWILYSKDRVKAAVDIAYRESGSGWVPDKWSWTQMASDGSIILKNEYTLTSYESDTAFTIDQFRMERISGMVVSDVEKDRVYQVGMPGQPDIDVSVLRGYERYESPWRRWMQRIGTGAVIAGVVIAACWYFRHRLVSKS